MGVDGGADAILEEGLTPDMVLGDMDSATDDALRCGAELVVHAYPTAARRGASGSAPWASTRWCRRRGTSQDVAMLLAHEKGAALIVWSAPTST